MVEIRRTLSIDLETYSEADLMKSGVYNYTEDPTFEILLFAYSWDGGEVTCIDLAGGQKLPTEVTEALTDPNVLKTAYNAPFERTAIRNGLGIECDPAQWDCSMILGAQAGLPLGLAAVSNAMGLAADKSKMSIGKQLINYFCMPCKPTAINRGRTRNQPFDDYVKWDKFIDYCIRDVEAENEIRRRLSAYTPDETEKRFWDLDQKINDAGVPVDLNLVTNAIEFDTRYKAELTQRAIALTGIDNPSSTSQIKAWLEVEEGQEFESLNKKSMPDVMSQITSDVAKQFLDIRVELSKSSTKKYDAIARCVCSDSKVRGLFQFYGANRTGRFAGRLVQVQNLPQNHMSELSEARALVKAGHYQEFENHFPNVTSTLSELIRTAFVPEPGHRFIVADFSAIEARVIAWFAKEEWVLEEFRGAGKIYEATAAQMFGVPKSSIDKGQPNYELRQKGKVATLACGYGGSKNALITMGALTMGLGEDELQGIVNLWRKANSKIVKWWYSLEIAAKRALETKGTATDKIGGIVFRYNKGILLADLPSGRSLYYYKARIGTNRFGSESIAYEGMNQTTKKWETTDTYGGKLAENIVQATARDCLREAMMNLDAAGYDIRMHVHDEVVITEPIGGRSVEDVCHIAGGEIDWLPGLPLRADGYETPFYRKD